MSRKKSQDTADGAKRLVSTRARSARRVLFLPSWYSREIHRGVAAYAREANWVLDTSASHGVQPFRYHPWRGDGILTLLGGSQEIPDFVAERCVPTVDLALLRPDLRYPRVVQDCAAQGRVAAEHLLQRQFRHLVFIGPKGPWPSGDRFEAFRQCALAAGCPCIDPDQALSRTADRGTWLAGHVASTKAPVGVMVEGDEVAVEVIDACRAAGLLVPEQVAIVGCHNDELTCDCAPVPLSSVDCNMFRQGYEAAALLDRLIGGHRAPTEPILIPPKGVVMRQSTNMLAVPNVEVAKAVGFIWENIADSRLGVDDVVDATALSRPGLNNAFRKHLDTAVGKFIRRTRLQRAMEMLRTTRQKTGDIAIACGYRDAEHLRSTLRRETGLSPRAWRRQHSPDDAGQRDSGG